MAGKNMNYFLMDGSPKGRVKCTLANWTGVAYKIPRVDLVKCKEIEHLKQSGVYFLFSREPGTTQILHLLRCTSIACAMTGVWLGVCVAS